MSTISIITNLKLDKKATERYNEIMNSESPAKDIQPISNADLQKGKEELAKWLTKSTH